LELLSGSHCEQRATSAERPSRPRSARHLSIFGDDAEKSDEEIAYENAVRYSWALNRGSADESLTADADTALDRLTDRQREVLRAVARGYTNFQVAAELGISVGTVKKHLGHIFERLMVQQRIGAAPIYLAGSQSLDQGQWWNVAGEAERNLVFPES
jgi:DNA-binding CsgD family transcriptional regulator